MIKNLSLFILLVSLLGCSILPFKMDAFEYDTAQLKTPEQVQNWLKSNTKYEDTQSQSQLYDKHDFVYHKARELWKTRQGICSNFACFYVYCARIHNYTCGTIFSVYPYFTHQRGWIKERDGTISITDNFSYFKSRFKNYPDMISNWKEKGFHTIRDEKDQKILINIDLK